MKTVYSKNTTYSVNNLIYQNFHKHSIYTNPIIVDSCAYPEDYAKRAAELGHGIISSVEHGYQGRYIESFEMAEKYNLKYLFGVEAYFVYNRFEKDNTNAHICLLAKNENGRKAINRILSEAAETGFYYRSRVDYELIMSLPEDDIWISTACLAGLWRYDGKNDKSESLNEEYKNHLEFPEPYEWLIYEFSNKFKDNFYLEVQSHNVDRQKDLNKKIVEISNKYNIEIIAGVDSHFILPQDEWKRDYLQRSTSGIVYDDEDGFYMDYPSGQTLFNRFKTQGVLSDEDIMIALDNTNKFLEVEKYTSVIFNKDMKMPSAPKYEKMTKAEKQRELVGICHHRWEEIKKEIPVEQHQHYLNEIVKELDIIFKIDHEDYFLLNYELIKEATTNRGGMITFSGRGCVQSGALIPTDKTLKKIEDVQVGDKVLSSDGLFHNVLNTYKYDIEEPMIQIVHDYGTNTKNPIVLTKEHKVLIYRDGKKIWVEAQDVKISDYVCCPKIKNNNFSEEYIDLNNYNIYGFEYDDDYIYEYNANIGVPYKYSPTDISQKIGCGKSLIENLANGKIKDIGIRKKELKKRFFEYVPFNSFEEYQSYIKNIRTKKIKRYIKNDYNYNVLIGLLYGDGCHRYEKHTISLALNSVTDKDRINRKFFEDFCKDMGFEIYEHNHSDKKLTQLTFTSFLYSEYLNQEMFNSKLNQDKVFNSNLFNQNQENLKGLKYGLWLADGSDKDGRISFDNTSLSLINAYKVLSMMVEDCGVCSISIRDAHIDNRGYHNKSSYKLRYPKDPFTTGRGHYEILQDNDFWYLRVKEVKNVPLKKTSVYDFTVEGMHDYLANNMIVHNSGPSFYVNHLLGFTQIDRISSPITLYPERFLSTSRMSAGSLADIDFNCGNTPVFEKTQEDILGEGHAYPMIAYGTMKPKSAWKMYCRAVDVDFEISNAISSKIDEYETDLKYWDEESGEEEPNIYDYIPDDLREAFDGSKEFLGLTTQASRHPCFVGDTLVNTNKGYVSIKDIHVGDKVLSHDGQYHTVLETMVNKSDDLYELQTGACEKIIGTGNHPFYVISKYKEKAKTPKGQYFKKVMYGEPKWKDLSELTKDDLIGIPINNNSIIPEFEGLSIELMSNKNFWWFVGRFVGDGWIEECKRENNRTEKRIKLCCSSVDEVEKQEIEEKLKDILQYRMEKFRTTYKFTIANDCDFSLFRFLKQFGKYAKHKFIPNFVIDLPEDLLKEFLNGYFSADGYLKKNNQIVFSTVSEKLYYSLSECIMKVYKTPARIGIREAQEYIIEGRLVSGSKQYSGKFFTHTDKGYLRRSIYKDGYLWVNVKSVTKIDDEQDVYNLSVNETNTYNVYNHIVHNCGNILLSQNIKEEVGIVRLKSKGGRETICACLDGKWCESYLMLKNDLLTVACVKLAYLLYERVGIPYMSLNGLLAEVKVHPEVWNMYEKGYVIGLNQVEKPSTQRKVMKYKPKNISELSAFIAGIRPAFKSLLDKLINREHFEYGIPTLDKLLQTEELPESFILYQEQIMKILSFAGIPMGDCYTVIKSISKKRFEKIMHYKEQFMTGMEHKLIEEEGISKERAEETAKTIWGIIEDASAYGFNSSHSLSVSFDSLLAAYFKALYPYEFYEVYLNLQMERADKAKALLAKKEMKEAFDISVLPMRFRQDNRKFVALPEQKALSNCLKSIKGFGDRIGEEFYKIKDTHYEDFIDFLVDIDIMKKNKEDSENYNPDIPSGFAVNGSQIETLIMLNYFEEFGKNYKLLKIFKLYNDFSSRKQINKKDINMETGVLKSGKDTYYLDITVFRKYIGKETKSMYKDLDMIGYVKEMASKVPDKSVDLLEQLKFERELLEFPIYQNPSLPKGWYYVIGFKTYGDKINTPYLVLYDLITSDLVVCSINKSKLFRDNPFGFYSIIHVKSFQDVVKKKKVGEKKFVPTNETKKVIVDYEVILRNEKEELEVLEQQMEEQKNKKEG